MNELQDMFLTFARNGDVKNLKTLLYEHQDTDINCKGQSKSNRGWSALHLASYFGHIDVVSHLLLLGANPNVTNSIGDTPLHRASFTSREAVVHKLLEYNADVFLLNDEQKKASDVACNVSIKHALQAAEKVQISKMAEKLFTAAKVDDVDSIVNLLKVHPDIVNANTQDGLGNTPLHYAAMRDSQSVAVYLLHHGGDSSIANKEGNTALDLCRSMHLKNLLNVQPIKSKVTDVRRFEGFLYRRHLLRPKLHWVVLEKGVLSYFARHADAVTGHRRRSFKYLTDAVVTPKDENNVMFVIKFFDSSVHYLRVIKNERSHINRQKWIQAIQQHIDYSSHYAKVGKLDESDSEDEDVILPIVDIQNTVETGFAHNELLKKQVEEFAVSVHKVACTENAQTQQLLGKCHQILSISNELTASLESCLVTLQRQDQVRKVQIAQEKEKTRVWQQAFEALAAEHHNLERTLSVQSPESLALMSASSNPLDTPLRDMNGQGDMTHSPPSSVGDAFLSDEEFFDAKDSGESEVESSPRETFISANSESQSLNDNVNNVKGNSLEQANGHDGHGKSKGKSVKTVAQYKHTEVDIDSGSKHSHIVEDVATVQETINGSHGTKVTHMKQTVHRHEKTRESPVQKSLDGAASTSSTNSDSVEADSKLFHDCAFSYREKLPAVMFSRDSFSFWAILKKCIGKELSKITMPVIFNEPLSFLQRLCEYMEYSYLLQRACESKDSVDRIQCVAAFAVSALASQLGRVGKPYNPLLGETFEYNRPDLGFSWVSEQVSHHPPVSAFHVKGTDQPFVFHGSVHPKLKFWGKSVEVEPKGVMTLTLSGLDETYTWSNPHCSVHNVVVGKPWIEQHGAVEIINHKTNEKCVLNFKSHSWFRHDLNKVEGYILDPSKTKVRYLEGDWTKHMFSLTPEAHEAYKQELNPQSKGKERKGSSSKVPSSSDVLQNLSQDDKGCKLLWKVQERPSFSNDYYNFTSFAMTLNEYVDGEKEKLAPTDTRHRPDVRCQENGDIDGAGDEKYRLEEKQRAARKIRAKQHKEWTPLWFCHDTNPVTNQTDWMFTDKYKNNNWSKCPDIF